MATDKNSYYCLQYFFDYFYEEQLFSGLSDYKKLKDFYKLKLSLRHSQGSQRTQFLLINSQYNKNK